MEKLRLSPRNFNESDVIKAAKAYCQNIDSNLFSQNSFESKFSALLNNNYVLATNSGTSALHLANVVLGIKPGDEVICPDFSFIAVANAIMYLSAKPVLVDNGKNSFTMSPVYTEEAILDRYRRTGNYPKAIILVHSFGIVADINRFLDISRKYNIPLIEDSAAALGSMYNGIQVGTFADIGVFSFNLNKIISTGGGGVLVTNNIEFHNKALYLAHQASESKGNYSHNALGFNYVMHPVAAEIGNRSLSSLKDEIATRRAIYNKFYSVLSDKFIFAEEREGEYYNRWLNPVISERRLNLDKLFGLYINLNIECKTLWKPIHLQPLFNDCPYYGGRESEFLYNYGITLPGNKFISEEITEKLIKGLKKI